MMKFSRYSKLNSHLVVRDIRIRLRPSVSRYSDYTIATKSLGGHGWRSGSWLCPGLA